MWGHCSNYCSHIRQMIESSRTYDSFYFLKALLNYKAKAMAIWNIFTLTSKTTNYFLCTKRYPSDLGWHGQKTRTSWLLSPIRLPYWRSYLNLSIFYLGIGYNPWYILGIGSLRLGCLLGVKVIQAIMIPMISFFLSCYHGQRNHLIN